MFPVKVLAGYSAFNRSFGNGTKAGKRDGLTTLESGQPALDKGLYRALSTADAAPGRVREVDIDRLALLVGARYRDYILQSQVLSV